MQSLEARVSGPHNWKHGSFCQRSHLWPLCSGRSWNPSFGLWWTLNHREGWSKSSEETRVEAEGLVLENQSLCPNPNPAPRIANAGTVIEWKELEGALVNSLLPLWGKSQGNLVMVTVGSCGVDLKKGMKIWKIHNEKLERGPLGTDKRTTELLWGNCLYLHSLIAINYSIDSFWTRTQTKDNNKLSLKLFWCKNRGLAKSSKFHKTEKTFNLASQFCNFATLGLFRETSFANPEGCNYWT